jgi:hypothetical protein
MYILNLVPFNGRMKINAGINETKIQRYTIGFSIFRDYG